MRLYWSPNIREKVGLETFEGIWGSGSRAWVLNKHKTPTNQENAPSNHIRLAKRVSSHKFRFPAFYPGPLLVLVKVSPYRRHVWKDIHLETIGEPGVVEPKVEEGGLRQRAWRSGLE